MTNSGPIICGQCFEEIPSGTICPRCGIDNGPKPPMIAEPDPEPVPARPQREPEPARRWRKLYAAEKLVIVLVVVVIVTGIAAGRLLMVAVGAAAVGLYFLPALAAGGKRNAEAVLILNIFLGWTLVGWVVALVWAATKDAPGDGLDDEHMRCPDCAEVIRREARVCKHCGRKVKAPA